MNVLFLVNGRFFKTLCKTVLNTESFSVSFSTEKHTITANISDKCYFTSIDNKSLDSLKTDFCFKRNYKNIKEFTAKLEDCFSTFINTSITDEHFCWNIDECISKILGEIKETKTETTEGPETAETEETTDPEVGKFVYDVRIHNDYGWDTYTVAGDDVESAVYKALKRVEYECGKEECSSIDVIRIYKEDSNELLKEIISKEREDPETAETETEATETKRKKRKPITTDIDMIKDFTKETAHAKSLLNSAYGITAERETAESVTTHKYEIRVFKDGAFSHSNTFSHESFAEYAFTIMELNAIDFPDPCFKVIQLFKDGKDVKRSIINFGVKVNNQAGEKWQIINKNTLDSIMKVFKCVQGNCKERIVVDGDHLNDILFDIHKYLMINDLLADKKPKKIHYDFRHMYPNNYITLPESTHFTIIYNRGFFYIDLNSIKRGFCPNRKTMNFFVEGEKKWIN